MNVKKKLISSLKKCFILSLCFVIGLAVSLQGFCASTTNIDLTKYYTKSLKASKGSSSWSVSSVPSITSNRYYQGVWASGNAFNAFGLTLALNNSNVNLVSVNSSYTYDICFDVCFEDSSSLSKVSSVAVDFGGVVFYSLTNFTTNSSGYRVYSFKENYLAEEVNSLLKTFGVSVAFSSDFTYTNVSIQNLRVVEHTPNEDVVNAIGSDTPNTSQIDEYNNAESQLIGGVQSSLDGITSQWNNINGNLSQYGGAFFALRQFFNGLTDLPFISVVVTLSVAIGVFALLLGSALSFVNRNRK